VDERYSSYINSSDELHEIAPFTTPFYPNYEDKLFGTNFSPTIIQMPELVAYINSNSDAKATAEQRIDKGGNEYRQYIGDEGISHILSINGGTVSFISKDDNGTYVLCQTGSETACAWARSKFNEFKRDSSRLVLKDIDGGRYLAPHDESVPYVYEDSNGRVREKPQLGLS
jgi:hypothetical protein